MPSDDRRRRLRRTSSSGGRDDECVSRGRRGRRTGERQGESTMHYVMTKNGVGAPSLMWWLAVAVVFVVTPRPTIHIADLWSGESNYEKLMQADRMDVFETFKTRPQGMRYRDDHSLFAWQQEWGQQQQHVWPVVTERRPPVQAVPQQPPQSRAGPSHVNLRDEPSLEDIDLIDVLWRSDIASEKEQLPGDAKVEPSEQYERDLQLLTEKSIQSPLTREEASRFEDLSKVYFEGFYTQQPARDGCKTAAAGTGFFDTAAGSRGRETTTHMEQPKREYTPTDADLDALFEDVKEGGELDRLGEGEGLRGQTHGPLLANASLASTLHYTPANVTELDVMVRAGAEAAEAAAMPLAPPPPLFNATEPAYWYADEARNVGYAQRDGVLNMTVAVSQLPPLPDLAELSPPSNNFLAVPALPVRQHQPSPVSQQQAAPQQYTPYNDFYTRRTLSMSNESSVCSSASSSATSPHYHSEMENYAPHESRYYGKMLPPQPRHSSDDDDLHVYYEDEKPRFGVSSVSCGPRRRGRQSKDEQLAAAHALPVSAHEIAEMSLPDLQKMLKSHSLSDDQKTLIRKIRRRGKNKVAARTCRMRRGEARSVQWVDSPRSAYRLA